MWAIKVITNEKILVFLRVNSFSIAFNLLILFDFLKKQMVA
jgi:hypothetical protein